MEKTRLWLTEAEGTYSLNPPNAQEAALIGLLSAVVEHDDSEERIDELEKQNLEMDSIIGELIDMAEDWSKSLRTTSAQPATEGQLIAKKVQRECAAKLLAIVNRTRRADG